MRIHHPERRLVIISLAAEVLFTFGEGVFVVYPLLLFFPVLEAHVELLGAGALAWAIWLLSFIRLLRPVLQHQTAAGRRYRLAQSVPRHAMALRLGLWGGLGLVAAALLVPRGELPPPQAFPLLNTCLVHSLALALLRWALHKRLLRGYLTQRGLNPPWMQLQADTLVDRLTEVALVLGAVTAAALIPFVFLFVPISLEQFLQMETYFPWTGVVLGVIWYFVVVPRQARPVLSYIQAVAAKREPAPGALHRACEAAHAMPLALALCKVGFFVLGAALLLVQSLALYQFSLRLGLLVSLPIVVVTLGTGIYEMIWAQAVLRPVVAHLVAEDSQRSLVRALSLRTKMMLAFGGAVVFTCLLAFFWAYLQYGNLQTDFAGTQARRELRAALAAIDTDRPQAIALSVARLDIVEGSHYLYVPAKGPAPALLPSTAVGTIRRRDTGVLELADQRLAGSYQRIDPRRPALGSLAVLIPEGESAKFALHLKVLVLFFLFVLSVSLGLVIVTSADLTQPLDLLEQRATAMAGGKLDLRVLPAGELDEIGRLTEAFEQMRVALRQKIETIEELNLGLEERIRLRTAELERSNAELVEAMEALKETQQRLITSEKLASIGQLVAGIAHEINNPINAVINSVNPLAETVEEALGAAASDPEAAAAARQDLEAMVRVIRSGAERTQRIVQALRNYARQDAEERSMMDLHADIEETLALLAHKLRGINLERDFRARAELSAYRGQLNQALMNLVSNAADALQGVDDPTIIVRTKDLGNHVVVEIEDNGPGIPKDTLPRIFDPFFTTKDVGKGTGLGLSITHRVMQRHGGSLGVHTEPGQTIFALIIPREEPTGEA